MENFIFCAVQVEKCLLKVIDENPILTSWILHWECTIDVNSRHSSVSVVNCNPFMDNAEKWSKKFTPQDFKVCLTIAQHYA